jgi:very-short-patch-repair endonuclease
MTVSERLLWERVRDRRFGGWKFRRQHAIGPYVVDFFCEELALVVEVDGGVHEDPVQRERDAGRQAVLEGRGLRFVRIEASALEADPDGVVARLGAALTPDPSPDCDGRGELLSDDGAGGSRD